LISADQRTWSCSRKDLKAAGWPPPGTMPEDGQPSLCQTIELEAYVLL
jgi:hypothetical protein